MNRRNVIRTAVNLLVVGAFVGWILLSFRPSPLPEMVLWYTQHDLGSSFTGNVYESAAGNGGTVWTGRMEDGYGLIAAEKKGSLYHRSAAYVIRDMPGYPVVYAPGMAPQYLMRYAGMAPVDMNDRIQGWFFGHVSDPDIVRVEVIWRAGHAQDNSETQSIVITEFQEGMFHFFLGFQSYIYDSPVFYDLTVGMDHILSAYDEDGELVCRYDDWDWETAPGPLEEGVHPVEPDWADGLDTTVKGSWTTVFYLRP